MGKKENQEIQMDRVARVVSLIGGVIAIVSAMSGVVAWLLYKSDDPFLKYYVITAVIVCGSIWVIMKFSPGESQKQASLILFVATAIISTLAIVWRGLSVWFYLKYRPDYPLPPGFTLPSGALRQPDYLPYFLLLGACVITIVSLILFYTVKEDNKNNRLPILMYFFGMSFYLLLGRIAWHVIDSPVWPLLKQGG